MVTVLGACSQDQSVFSFRICKALLSSLLAAIGRLSQSPRHSLCYICMLLLKSFCQLTPGFRIMQHMGLHCLQIQLFHIRLGLCQYIPSILILKIGDIHGASACVQNIISYYHNSQQSPCQCVDYPLCSGCAACILCSTSPFQEAIYSHSKGKIL